MTLEARHRQIVRRRALLITVAGLALIGLLVALFTSGDPAPEAPAEPSTPISVGTVTTSSQPVAQVDPDQYPAPGMDPELAPPDGPALDSPPFDVDALAMRDELRTHGVDLPDDQLGALVEVADKYIAEGDLDLDAWDPRIMRDVRALWPNASRAQVIDTTRCLAEYVERVEARNAGLPHPPDEDDDHSDTVDGRGPQPRVVTPTS